MRTKAVQRCVVAGICLLGANAAPAWGFPRLFRSSKLPPAAVPAESPAPATQLEPPAAAPAPELPDLVDRLSKLGEEAARATEPSEIVFANLQQADVLAQIMALSGPQERA